MLMLYELEVLQSDSERIGEPVALPLTDIINSGASTNRLGTKLFNEHLEKFTDIVLF